MATAISSTSPASAYPHKSLPIRTVSLTYYLGGRHHILRFETDDPLFRQTISELRKVDRPFRIIYD